ncbi:hypothetical protein GOBAR_AA01806 [Gossypium barbadense]|uniref:DEK-C domain-containing protein n=1 Tax=Gossypium barbadense TaxID=3634 RepID=A0A2P5YT32_GOSBA|nr:hypothetical protein GOBAR_AA01806 [Gossypium barbadense]
MAEEAHGNPAAEKEAKEEAAEMDDIESRITTAMRSRVGHFKEQSDSLTFEGVRRLLEKDLGLESFALDVHKRFVKQCLLKWLDDGNDNEGSSGTVEKNVSTTTEGTESPKGRQPKKEIKEPCSEDEKLEESPVLGLLSDNKTVKNDNKENKEVSESKIKKAIRNRASYVKANSEKVTMAGLRRLLEEDLKLDKYTLDPYKKFIAEQLDELLKSAEVSAPASEVKKKNLKKNSQSKTSEKLSKKIKNSEGLKKRKIPKKEAEMPSKKRSKHAERNSDDNSNEEDSESVSDDGRSQSSSAKAVKRKETSAPVYGKRVEHLKSVIKSCGMSVPPSIYKRVKQVPENKREAQLIKELEEVLSKEGLSAKPSEKGQDSSPSKVKNQKKKKMVTAIESWTSLNLQGSGLLMGWMQKLAKGDNLVTCPDFLTWRMKSSTNIGC